MTELFHLHLFTQLHSFESQILNCVYWKDISTTTKVRDQLFSKSSYRKGISEIEKLQLDSSPKIPKITFLGLNLLFFPLRNTDTLRNGSLLSGELQ